MVTGRSLRTEQRPFAALASEISRWTVAGILASALVAGCAKVSLNLDNLPCDAGQCLDGYRCNPATNLCEPESTSCSTGSLHDCASCGDDCTISIANATPICRDDGAGTVVCDYEGSCSPGFVDGDGTRTNGCECTYSGPEIPCNGVDEDCVGGDAVITGQTDHCAGCADDCLSAGHVASALCDTSGATPHCAVTGCSSGWVDGNGDADDGCETACTVTGSEVCDGQDNDCDGQVDDGIAAADIQAQCDAMVPTSHVQTWSCDRGCMIGQCATGYWNNDASWANGCEYACTASGVETCDGNDDDCNGVIDDVSDINGECSAANATAAHVATWRCRSGWCAVSHCDAGFVDGNSWANDGCEQTCTPTTNPTEVCDGQDNDCNGTVDDVDPTAMASACAAVYPSATFVRTWTCTGGACAIDACVSDHWDHNTFPSDGCEYPCVYAGPETCNGADDDCDGDVDTADTDLDTYAETFVDCGLHECSGCGVTVWACTSGACEVVDCQTNYYDIDTWPSTGCEYPCNPVTPGAERCDGEDNDCNGHTDAADDALNAANEIGADCSGRYCTGCSVSEWGCTGGACVITGCATNRHNANGLISDGCEYACNVTSPPTEVCDNRDNDCNGKIDTADPALDTSAEVNALCAAQRCGNCQVTAWSCQATGCAIGQCESGYIDKDTDPATGCEVACSPETDPAFCLRLALCGSVTGVDNCGAARTATCGGCTSPNACGGCGVTGVCGSWWNAAWTHRRRLTVTTGAATVTSPYSVSVSFDHNSAVSSGQSLANGNDVRLLWRNGTTWTELDRVLDPDSSWDNANTLIWFSLSGSIAASSASGEYFVYFGNPSAGAPPANEGNVFHFADFFDRADSDAVGNGWAVDEGSSGDIDVASNELLFNTMNDLNNRPLADHTFGAITSASDPSALVLRLGFNWVRTSEGTYRLHLQLANSPAVPTETNAFINTAAGPSLVWTGPSTTNITNHETLASEVAGVATPIVVISGSHRVEVVARVAGATYDVLVDGTSRATNIPFSSAQTSLNTVRLLAWQINQALFTSRSFTYLIVRKLVTPEPATSLGGNESYVCP